MLFLVVLLIVNAILLAVAYGPFGRNLVSARRDHGQGDRRRKS